MSPPNTIPKIVSTSLLLSILTMMYSIKEIIAIGVKYFKLVSTTKSKIGMDTQKKFLAKNNIINMTSIITIFCKRNWIVFISIEFPRSPYVLLSCRSKHKCQITVLVLHQMEYI